MRAVPPAPGPGTHAVSDLPFLSANNGWGPVERDTSNGEQAGGDGGPITIYGVQYAKGLGTNSPSDVQLYLAGSARDSRRASGVDDETRGGGTVTFSVIADGTTLVTTPVQRARTAATSIDVPVDGTQVLELVVGDGGDGNGNDHGDWANPTLTGGWVLLPARRIRRGSGCGGPSSACEQGAHMAVVMIDELPAVGPEFIEEMRCRRASSAGPSGDGVAVGVPGRRPRA